MSAKGKTFFDTNVLLYLLSADSVKAHRAEDLMSDGGVISVQVLNEFASVATRKLRMAIAEVQECLDPI
ncbi:MAG TPA: PIN domain-containing protein, partial [Burkholderiales bacterium]